MQTHPTIWKGFIMKPNKLLLAAILASAIGALIMAFAEDKSVPTSSQMPIERYAHTRARPRDDAFS